MATREQPRAAAPETAGGGAAASSAQAVAPPRPGRSRAELTRLCRLSQLSLNGGGIAALLSQYAVEAVAATGATRGFIALAQRETGGLEVVATAGDGWTEAARRDRLCRRCVNGGTITLRVASTGRAVRVDDVTLDDATLDANYQPFFEGVRSVLAVPIAQGPEARVRGVINLESDVPGEFTPDEEAFVAVLADLAALRLEMEDMNAREAALVRIGKDLSIAADADALMKKVADVAAEILHFEDCSIFLIDKASRRLMLVATRGPLAPQIGRASYAPGEGLTGWVAEHGTSIRLGDPREDRRHRGLHQEFPSEQVGAFLAVPIRSHTGIVGVLRVLRKRSTSPWFPNLFTEEDEQVLATIASQVGAAIDNAQLFAQLVQAERMAVWGEMSAMSSHMIGNRVFAIKGDLNELEYRLGAGAAAGPDEIAPLVESMKRGIFRLEELLAEFRDFVRATALNTSPLDVTELTRSVLEETFPKRGAVALSTDYAVEPLPVLADPVKLKRAFSEIVENAVTFQECGGTLHVATRRVAENEPPPPLARVNLSRGQGYACVEFADAGPGIPEGDKEKIFRPFFTSRNRGMGLGLAIVKGIIEAHHGAIVEAGEPGAGARFLIFLPLSPDSSGGGVTKQTEERKAT